jgi:sugar lactone lactonase YvrE
MKALRSVGVVVSILLTGSWSSAQAIDDPSSVASDRAGGVYIAIPRQNRVLHLTAAGALSIFAGGSRYWFSGDGGPARSALLAAPESIAVDTGGNVFIADTWNHRVRKVGRDGVITTVVGTGSSGFGGDGGPASAAQLFSPETVAVDAAGNLFIGESGNHRIRKVTTDGVITTVAGNGTSGFSGDGGQATAAQLAFPRGVAVDQAGNLYIGEGESGNRIRKVGPNGIITTVAGNGTAGFGGDGGPAISAQISNPRSVAVDAAGNLFIVDTHNHRIRRVDSKGIITTVAGDGTAGFSGDGGPATAAQLNFPQDVVVDTSGNLFIADLNDRIRKVSPGGVITTLAANPGNVRQRD